MKPHDASYRAEVTTILLARMRDAEGVLVGVKAQRWDVVKWVITVTFGLITAEAAFASSRMPFVAFACLVAAMGSALVWHYNRRATGARATVRDIRRYLYSKYPDLDIVLPGEAVQRKTLTYDAPELFLFTTCMWASVMLTLVVPLKHP